MLILYSEIASFPAQAEPRRCPQADKKGRTMQRKLTVEMLGGHVGIALKLLVEVDDGGGEDGEQRTETEDDDVADGLGEGGVALEVTRLAGVIGEGGDELICEPIDDGLRRHGGDGLISFVLTLLLLLLRQFGRMRSKIKARAEDQSRLLPLVVTFLVAWPARDFSLGACSNKTPPQKWLC